MIPPQQPSALPVWDGASQQRLKLLARPAARGRLGFVFGARPGEGRVHVLAHKRLQGAWSGLGLWLGLGLGLGVGIGVGVRGSVSAWQIPGRRGALECVVVDQRKEEGVAAHRVPG